MSESEQYEILQEGLNPYLVEKDLDLMFYDHFIPTDTSFSLEILSQYETMNPPIFDIDSRIYVQNITKQENKINTSILEGMKFINNHDLDSLRKINDSITSGISDFSPFTEIFALTRPFKPDTSNLVLIEILPIEIYESCFPTRPLFLVLEKEHNKWIVKQEL
ncbi:MAG: hypothetical protein JNJ99_06890 [Crocinitomicaceae bacterium]|nr:hypothetical protein [Crocinitomicaceae bacterium]